MAETTVTVHMVGTPWGAYLATGNLADSGGILAATAASLTVEHGGPEPTREDIEGELYRVSGNFSAVLDFNARWVRRWPGSEPNSVLSRYFETGWASEDGEMAYHDCFGSDED